MRIGPPRWRALIVDICCIMRMKEGEAMITLTLLICVIMLLMWLGLSSLGIAFSDGLGWFLFLAASAVVFVLYGRVSGWFRRR